MVEFRHLLDDPPGDGMFRRFNSAAIDRSPDPGSRYCRNIDRTTSASASTIETSEPLCL